MFNFHSIAFRLASLSTSFFSRDLVFQAIESLRPKALPPAPRPELDHVSQYSANDQSQFVLDMIDNTQHGAITRRLENALSLSAIDTRLLDYRGSDTSLEVTLATASDDNPSELKHYLFKVDPQGHFDVLGWNGAAGLLLMSNGEKLVTGAVFYVVKESELKEFAESYEGMPFENVLQNVYRKFFGVAGFAYTGSSEGDIRVMSELHELPVMDVFQIPLDQQDKEYFIVLDASTGMSPRTFVDSQGMPRFSTEGADELDRLSCDAARIGRLGKLFGGKPSDFYRTYSDYLVERFQMGQGNPLAKTG